MGPFGYNEERVKVIEFGNIFTFGFNQVVVFQSYPKLNPWGFLLPYPSIMWLGIFGSILIIIFLLRFLAKKSLYEACLQAYGMMLAQGKRKFSRSACIFPECELILFNLMNLGAFSFD